MARLELPIVSGLYVSEVNGLSDRRLTNMYPIIAESEGTTAGALTTTPGITEAADLSGSAVNPELGCRGALLVDPFTYRVVGNTFYRANQPTLGSDIDGTNDVTMASNGINVLIQVKDGKGYFYNIGTNTVAEITDAVYLAFGSVRAVAIKSGFYVYVTNDLFFSGSFKDVNDGEDFNALDFEDAELSTGRIDRPFVNNDQLYILKTDLIEVYQTIVTSAFPFQRIPGATIPIGIFTTFAIAEFENGFIFIGGNVGQKPAIWKVVGSSFEKISDSSVEFIIQQNQFGFIVESRCWVYGENGAYFAVFTVGNDTLVYDSTTRQWHARQTGVGNGESFFPWRAVYGIRGTGQQDIEVGDDRSALIGQLDKSVYTEYGNTIERVIPTIPFQNKASPIFHHEIELYMRTGVGSATVPDPQIRMEYSKDNGVSFLPERFRSLGLVGQRNIRVRWSRLGRSPKSRMYQFKVTDPVPVEIYGLYGDAE